ncbi:glycosyltransferase family 2 protein [Pokkaliibacter plantistimulans]|nr:glycosyltransferase [Pokkaliibacter plantistimulans]
MSSAPLITVIIPVYNAASHLIRTLASVFSQSIPLNVICINDGSTDSSAAVLAELSERYLNLTVIDKDNEGPAAARNLGLTMVSTPFLIFMDADDYISDGAYATLLDVIVSEKADVVFHGYQNVLPNGEVISQVSLPRQIFDNGVDCFTSMQRQNYLASACFSIYRTAHILDNNIKFPLNSNFEDAHFYRDVVVSAKCVVVIPDIFYSYVQYEKSRSRQWNVQVLFDYADMFCKNIDAMNSVYDEKMKCRASAFVVATIAAGTCDFCKSIFIDYLKKMLSEVHTLVIYGTGTGGRRLNKIVSEIDGINTFFSDSSEEKVGTYVDGIPVRSPHSLIELNDIDTGIIIGSSYVSEIYDLLNGVVIEQSIFLPDIRIIRDIAKERLLSADLRHFSDRSFEAAKVSERI